MTSPTNVGSASVDLVVESRNLAKQIRAEVEQAFKGLDFSKLIQDAIGNKPIKLPISPDVDPDDIDEQVKKTRPPRVPVVVDPLFDAFRQELKRQTAALAKQASVKLPVEGDTAGLRAEIGSQLAAISNQLKITIPAEPGDRAKLQTELQEQVAEISRRLKAHVEVNADTEQIPEQVRRTRVPPVKVEVDPLLAAFQQQVRRQTAALARTVNANVPVGADTSGLRAHLGAALAEIQAQSRIRVPTEPGAKAEYEARLKAQLAEVARQVKQTVHVDVDVDKGGGKSSITSLFNGLSTITKAIPGIGSVTSGLADIVGGMQKVIGTSAQMGGSIAGALETASGPAGIVVGAIVAIASAAAIAATAIVSGFTFAIPAATALAGAIAAIPAALTGVGAAAGTLFLGFKGIFDAFKTQSTGGGGAGSSAAQQARQIASASRAVEAAKRGITAANRGREASERSLAAAERGLAAAEQAVTDAESRLTDAQRRAQAAQAAISKARQDAVEDIEDLNRSLRGAVISEREAAQAVEDAKLALSQAQVTGDIPSIVRAQNALDRANLTLEEAQDTRDDLTKQTDAANKAGVEGSDKVQSALQDQADALKAVTDAQQGVVSAQNGVIDATDSLKSAQDGVASALDGVKSAADGLASAQDGLAAAQEKTASGAGGLTKQMVKLSPSAQKFVNAIKSLKPAFESLRLDVQERLFSGLDKTVTHVGDAWIPALKTTLGSYADTFNGFFKSLGASISTPKFISDIQAGAEGFRQLLAKVGTAITADLLPAFGSLSRAAGPFLSALGGELATVVKKFSEWVQAGEKSGGLQRFFVNATKAMHDIFDIGGSVASIIGSIISIITGQQVGTSDKSPLESFKEGLDKVSAWLKDPQNQQKIRGFISDVSDAVGKMIEFAKKVGQVVDGFNTVIDKISEVRQRIKIALGLGQDADTPGKALGAAVAGAVNPQGNQSLLDMGKAAGRDLIQGLTDGIKEKIDSFKVGPLLWEGPNSLVGRIKRGLGISSPSTVMMGVGRDLVLGLISGIGQMLNSLAANALNIKNTVLRGISNAGTWLYNTGHNVVVGLENGIGSMLGNLSSWTGRIKNTVQNTLSNAGNWLYAHGRAVISGLINGIASKLGDLGNFLGQVGSFIQAHKGPIDKDRLLLVGAGQAIMGGLITGIDDKKSALADKLADLTTLVAGTPFDATLGIAAQADAISNSLSVDSNRRLELSWKNGASADPVLRAFQELISVQFNGDVNAAFAPVG